jgi:hypothetical protein
MASGTALRVADLLGDEHLLVGAGALAAWGHVRSCDRVEFVTRLTLAEVSRRLTEARIKVVRRARSRDIPWTIEGDGFNVRPAFVPLDFDRAVIVDRPDGQRIRVVDLEGLIRMLLKSGRRQDLEDVAILLRAHPEKVDEALRVAQAYGIGAELAAAANACGQTPSRRMSVATPAEADRG